MSNNKVVPFVQKVKEPAPDSDVFNMAKLLWTTHTTMAKILPTDPTYLLCKYNFYMGIMATTGMINGHVQASTLLTPDPKSPFNLEDELTRIIEQMQGEVKVSLTKDFAE